MARPPDSRSEARSNVFLTAAMNAGGKSFAVRIRNLSPNGGLLEGDVLPPSGTTIRLTRGELAVAGEIAWQDGRFAGCNWDSQIDVTLWVRRVGHAGQARTDEAVAAIRAQSPLPTIRANSADALSLKALSDELDAICQRLLDLVPGSISFGEELVRLDTIASRLRAIAVPSPRS